MAKEESKEEYIVLVGDDSEDDRLFMRRILRRLPGVSRIEEVHDGHEVISYLDGAPPFDDRKAHPLPHLLILDLKMPCKTGHEVLEWLQTSPYREISVIVVSGSALPADISTSLGLGASAYHQKSAMQTDQSLLLEKIAAILKKRLS